MKVRAILLLLALQPMACGLDEPIDLFASEALSSNLRLCGFPAGQLVYDPGRGGYTGRVHVGQRIPLELTGGTSGIRSLSWSVRALGLRPPVARLTGTGTFAAVLEGVAAGGTGERDYALVGADVEFRDGSQAWVNPSECRSDGFGTQADRVVVVP
jgi:hypothetical protein